MTADVDLIVAGGGPVGLATAIEARMRGLTVAVIEPRTSAIDKACGEGLMPGALPALARLGVDPAGFELRGVSYRSATRRVDHLFPDSPGRGVRRTTLHEALRARAGEVGAVTVVGRVEGVVQDASGVSGGGIRGRYLIAADGLHSSVRRSLGVERPVRGRKRFGLRRHFVMQPESDLIEIYWTPTVEAYVTPVGDGVVGISMLGVPGTDFEATLAGIPDLARRVKGAEPASSLRGAGPFHQRTTRRVVGRVMLVGDASGYVDAITGEGIRVGLAQAQAAVDCIVADAPLDYERRWTTTTRDFRVLTAGLVRAATSPLRGAIVPTATRLPRVFGATVDRLAR
ncbi:MAG: monooxygenase [Microbacteriaceae bacterium]|nr:monooxygenase [Microbacteriaceae bacterium]